jgi:NAD(P)H-dependent FMN reductase
MTIVQNLNKSIIIPLCNFRVFNKIEDMHNDQNIKIHIILGSTRPERISDKPGKWIFDEARKREGVEAELLDLRNYPMPFYNERKSPSALEGKYSDDIALKWVKKIGEGDAYIIIAPEYNHGYPAVLKNALDYPYYEWNKKPVGFISYGNVGGARSVEQLRQVAVELELVPINEGIHIRGIRKLINEKGEFNGETFTEDAKDLLDQLLWWAKLLKKGREEK